MTMPPIELEIHNEIPLGKGMGSSAAALTAGVVIADELLELGWKPLRILDEAARLEGHPDNVAPCTLGSIVASAIDSGGVARAVRLDLPQRFGMAIVVPDFDLPTVQGARGAAFLVQPGGRGVQCAARGVADCGVGYGLDLGVPGGARRSISPAVSGSLWCRGWTRSCKLRAPGLLGCALSGAGPSILVFFERGYESVCDLVRADLPAARARSGDAALQYSGARVRVDSRVNEGFSQRRQGSQRRKIAKKKDAGTNTGMAGGTPAPRNGYHTGMLRILIVGAVLGGGLMASSDFDQAQAARFAALALDCVHKPYPNKIAHSLNSDADVKAPRELTPAFYGCYDWHSSVHGHWLLVRLARLFPQAPFAGEARRAVAQSLTPANIAAEVSYLRAEGRNSFERPYGLAWLLQLAAELKEFDDPEARQWSAALRPLERGGHRRGSPSGCRNWRTRFARGEHNNTAFSMGLMLDYARVTGNAEFGRVVESRVRDYYLKDTNCPLAYEPSGEDFLSPCLAEADVVRRVLAAGRIRAVVHGVSAARGVGADLGERCDRWEGRTTWPD